MMKHYPVMLAECIEGLNISPNGIYVDGTLGRAGHSSEILKRLKNGHLYCFDIDQSALDESEELLSSISKNFTLIKSNFANMKDELMQRGVEKVDGILLDIGVSSPQFDDSERGFSYRFDSRLDMRMDRDQTLDAYQIVNEYEFNDLVRIFREYGEEPYAKNIARNIEKSRQIKPIETTYELVDIIKASLPAKVLSKTGHPAKQVFQSLRIECNKELDSLKKAVDDGLQLLNSQGRMAIITFQSLEDEIVKAKFKAASSEEKIDKHIPVKQQDIRQADYQLINRKPITASEKELEENHRSKSAKLRIIERR